MKSRREFAKWAAGAALAGASAARGAAFGVLSANSETLAAARLQAADRALWCGLASRLANPVLTALAHRRLKIEMPVEAKTPAERARYSHLEALGRLLCGLAPWLELGTDDSPEGKERARLSTLARAAIDAATDPASPDFLNFSSGSQPLVDAAFLAQAMLRAPGELWEKLEKRVQENVIAALRSSRVITPGNNNWTLFATLVEVMLFRAGEKRDESRMQAGLKKHQQWYLGDGVYGDGPEFHWDYYNSFVIQPMLLDALNVLAEESSELKTFQHQEVARLRRWAAIQERLVAPDGTYPAIGRSITYRCGAFQGLAAAAWRKILPAEVSPPQARAALTAVIRRTLETPGAWDANGWLTVGLSGHQPALGEEYISTGSLYLCSAAFLPLGLRADDAFWTGPAARTTWQKIWSGENLPVDHALRS